MSKRTATPTAARQHQADEAGRFWESYDHTGNELRKLKTSTFVWSKLSNSWWKSVAGYVQRRPARGGRWEAQAIDHKQAQNVIGTFDLWADAAQAVEREFMKVSDV